MLHNPDDHVLDYVDALVHDLLSDTDAALVTAHCEACPICRVAFNEARRRQHALQSLPPVEAPEALIRATQERIEKARQWRFSVARVGWLTAAMVVLAVAGTHFYYANLKPSPYDLRVLGQADLLAGAEASLRVLLLNPATAAPQIGVPIEIELFSTATKATAHLASFTTDQFGSGAVRMLLPNWTPGKYQLRVSAKTGWSRESVTHAVTLRRSWQLMLTSDKPVYQPGGVIRLRSLALARPQGKPVAGHEVTFSVIDPKGNTILRNHDVTSRFGIASIDCPLASEILEGPYQICCTVGDTTSKTTVEVKKYVLPKFKIAVELNEPYYQPGQKVRGKISARYFFGKPVVDGQLAVAVKANKADGPLVPELTLKTDAQGEATFEFRLPEWAAERPEGYGDEHFSLTASLLDTAGQKQSATISRSITQRPIRIEVIPEGGTLMRGVANRIYFLTTYADGRPAPARIVVSGMLNDEVTTSDLGAARIEYIPAADKVHWTVRAEDKSGRIGRLEVQLTCGRKDEQFLVRTDKAVYDGGQTMRVSAIGGGNEPIFLDLIQDGQTVLTDTIPMAGGRGEYQFDLPPGLSGTLQLCAYRVGRSCLPIALNRLIYVRSAQGLKVDARLDRDEYRPGKEAKLTVSLADTHGKPVVGALSLSAVDEAVYSVLGRSPGMESVFSSTEQKLLEPMMAAYPWSPDLKTPESTENQDRFQQALFALARPQAKDRDALLRQVIDRFAEGDRYLLQVLERPDWEELMEDMPGMEKYLPLLRSQDSIWTLRDSSYHQASFEIESLRRQRLEQIKVVWVVIGVVGVFVILLLLIKNGAEVLAVLVILALLVGMLLPAVQSAREAGRRLQSVNDLRQLGMALENYESAGGQITPADGQAAEVAPARVREWFPETLLWRPELITDESGRASLSIDLADSITTWRLSASAVSADGKLGASQSSIRVFQPFFVDLNLPVSLTRGDEVTVPAVVYNYLDKPLTVELRLEEAAWFESLDPAVQKLDLAAGEVRAVSYRLRARQAGRHELSLHASGGDIADAIKRSVEVTPDGRRVEQTAGGTLQQPAKVSWTVPVEATEGSVKAIVRFYPSTFSQLVDGLEGIFRQPYGCFEQTSSTTYPNVLALDYLQRTKKSVPQVEAKARQYIHLGYQRLLGFEVAGGGFDWFGHGPANLALTAYGLMEFRDMAKVHEVDAKLIERTRNWLLEQQTSDGSWAPRGHSLYEDPTLADRNLERLSTTAYIAWSVFDGSSADRAKAKAAMQFLIGYEPATINDPYVLALVANALQAIDPNERAARAYLDRLETLCSRSADGKLVWWDRGASHRTMFYGTGRGGNIETTAMATLAMLHRRANCETIRGALAWLVTQKDSGGTWHSTQATVLALKALLAATGQPLGEGQPRQIEIALNGKSLQTLKIPAEESDVTQQIDLSAKITAGSHTLIITERPDLGTGYQATLVYHLPDQQRVQDAQSLAIRLDYDKTSLAVGDHAKVTATVTNQTAETAPMLIVDLPIPAGFTLEADDLTKLQDSGKIAKVQFTPRSAIVYLRAIGPSESLELCYRLRGTMPAKVTVPPARVYEYYDPDRQASTDPITMTVDATAP